MSDSIRGGLCCRGPGRMSAARSREAQMGWDRVLEALRRVVAGPA